MSTDLSGRFFGEGNDLSFATLPDERQALATAWRTRLHEGGSSITFLPRELGNRSWWYGVAPSASSKRELLELLDAWVGATYSDLPMRRGALDRADRFDREIDEIVGDRVLKFETLPSAGVGRGQASAWTWSRLRLLDELLVRRPTSRLQGPRQIRVVLDDLGLAISSGDKGLADRLLLEMARDGGLDETNVAFQRVRVQAGFDSWEELLADPSIPDLLGIRRPPGVSRAIVRAVYEQHLSRNDQSGADHELLASYRAISDSYGGLVRGSPEPITRAELIVQFLAALGPEGSPPMTAWMDRLQGRADVVERGLGARLNRLLTVAQPLRAVVSDPFDEAQDLFWAGDSLGALEHSLALAPSPRATRLAVLAAAEVGTVEAATRVLDLLRSRPAEERDALAAGGPFQGAVTRLEQLGTADTPMDWRAWFARIDAGTGADEAIGWVRASADGWPLLAGNELKGAIEQASDQALALIGEVSGILLAAHREVLGPSELVALGERLLLALALAGRRSEAVRSQTVNLVDIVLQGAPTSVQVSSMLEVLRVLVDSMAMAGTVDWLVDLLGVTTYYYAPDGATSEVVGFGYLIADHLRRLRGSLDSSLRAQIEAAFESLGVETPNELARPAEAVADESEKYACLEGQHVVIYSLMESAARRATDSLRRLVPRVQLDNASGHVGSSQLAELARVADVFVIVTAAAKHAATQFIEDHRVGPVVYVNSKGTTALLRGLAAVCAGSTSTRL